MTGEQPALPPLLTDLPAALDGWPRTPATIAAIDFIHRHEPAHLVHHSIRSYLYARRLGQARGLDPGEDYDDETMFLGAVLHDIGLTDQANGSQRFEVDGADRAARFARDHGLSAAAADMVWDAVALHTSPGIVNRKRAEIALPAAGIAADLFAYGAAALDPELLTAAHHHLPRHDLGNQLTEQIAAQILDNPAKLVPFTFSAAALQWKAPTALQPSLAQMVLHAFPDADDDPEHLPAAAPGTPPQSTTDRAANPSAVTAARNSP